jgi:hypothetical protein
MNLGFFLPLIAYCLKRGSPHYDASKEFQVPGFVMELNRLIFR